ncbi:MAG: ABC transporter permease [Deltaproteobacteria bacterium]|nr:ABC transporter permease [Deltaproteobacteria bacterium]
MMRMAANHFYRAVADVRENLGLHVLAASTIGLIFLLSGTFALALENLSALMERWHDNARIMVYLEDGAADEAGGDIGSALEKIPGVTAVDFISAKRALEELSGQLGAQAGVLEGLEENPLPDAYELTVDLSLGAEVVRTAARMAGEIPGVADVEYGQAWLSRFEVFVRLFRVFALSLGILLLVAGVFITASTIRLVLYNRAEEISIMRLVGATEGFIRAPFYIQGAFQGLAGGLLALALLAILYAAAASGMSGSMVLGGFSPRFLPAWAAAAGLVLACATGLAGAALTFVRPGEGR